jgi:hypothetical protein
MYKEYIQTTYTSQIDKNIIRTENKMKTNYATRDYDTCIFYLAISCVDLNSLRNIRYPARVNRCEYTCRFQNEDNCVMSLGPHRKSPGRIYKCHFTSGRRDSDRILEYMCHNIWQ